MLAEAVGGARAWKAESIDERTHWYCELSAQCRTACEAFVEDFREAARDLADLDIRMELRQACEPCLAPLRHVLERGRGFAILEGVPVERYSLEEAQAMYWLIGQVLGEPIVQNIQGVLLYDVRDTGQNVQEGARFSVTNAESTFHTDCAFNAQMPDYVGLLCMQTARSGGESQLVSSYALHNALLESHPEALEALYGEFYFDRRGQFGAGESPYSQFPIYRWHERQLTTRYMHYYIEVGHEEAGRALGDGQLRALALVKELVESAEFQVEFNLEPGQMLFVNNHWILHNRTAFEDHAEVQYRRHYVRLWLKRRN